MKTKMFFVAAAVAVISLSSCKSDYECTCEVDQPGAQGSITVTYNDVKEDDAEEACNGEEGNGVTCTLNEI